MRLHYVRRLLGIQGYSIAKVTVEERRGRQAVALEPKRLRRSYECGKWQRKLKTAHSSWRIEFQHLLPLWQYPTFLRMRRFRVCWPQCGLNLEPLPFAADGPMVTCPLATLVHELCKVMTVQAAGTLMLLHGAPGQDHVECPRNSSATPCCDFTLAREQPRVSLSFNLRAPILL